MQDAFSPQDLNLLTRVVERACSEVGYCDETARATIAARVIYYAGRGERDFDRLLQVARGNYRWEIAHAA